MAVNTHCHASLLTSSLSIVCVNDLNQIFSNLDSSLTSHHTLATDFQSSSSNLAYLSIFSLFSFFMNGFLTAIPALRSFLMRLQLTVDSSSEGPDASLRSCVGSCWIFFYFVRKLLSDTLHLLQIVF